MIRGRSSRIAVSITQGILGVSIVIAYVERAHAKLRPVSPGDRRLVLATRAGFAFLLLYGAATIGGAPRPLLSQIFNAPMALVLIVAWCAAIAAPQEIRTLWLLLAGAATCWAVGSVGWAIQFEQNRERVPTPPTVWDIPFAIALTVMTVAVALAIRGSIVIRHAALDALVVSCAAISIGTALGERSFQGALSLRTLAALDRPFFGLLTLVLVVSAALGSSEGVRRSTVLLGVGQVFLVAGHLVYSYQSLSGGRIDDRWCDLAWATGAVVSIIGGLCVILRTDPLIRFGPPITDSPHPRGSRAALASGLGALVASMAMAFYGAVTGHATTATVGIGAALVCAGGVALRGRAAFRAADAAYLRLDREVDAHERRGDALERANTELGNANIQLRLYQSALRNLLGTADARSRGQLRDLVTETTGAEFAELDEPTAE
jgi:hypothetical protein